ncbi:MAG: Na/Pi symporter [archaeon]
MTFSERTNKILHAAVLFLSLYFFLVSIKLMGGSFKLMGSGFAETLLSATANPLTALFIGILATAIIQSSSSTTSIIVAFVGAGMLPLEAAIPMVMGANIGTTVTNTLVSFAHLTRRSEFRLAFSSSIVHLFFNAIIVMIFFPLEQATHILQRTAIYMADMTVGTSGMTFTSPLDQVITPVVKAVIHVLPPQYMILISVVVLMIALKYLVTATKVLFISGRENFLSKYLFKTAKISFVCGFLLTALVQSSSITTSLVVPFAGAGLLSLEQIFPFALGANIGTTVTAFLAALVTGTTMALALAYVHILFNSLGAIVIWPIRKLPIWMAEKMGEIVEKKRRVALIYVAVIFYILPLMVLILSGVI